MAERYRRIREVLRPEEIRSLVTPTDWEGWLALLASWSLIAFSFVLVGWRPNILTVPLALVILGGRQLGLAVLMHEAAHRCLFRGRRLNDLVGEWLCAAPSWNHLHKYREHHMAHHNLTGTERDPDIGLVTPFPVSKGSLARKLSRDLLGISGVKRVIALLLMDFGLLRYTASVNAVWIDQKGRGTWHLLATGCRNLAPVLLTNAALLGLLWLAGHPWLYGLWLVAYLTTHSLFMRVRSMAEHACTEAGPDQFRNTRTTAANLAARLTVAPHRVNYHLEHHLLMTVPHYRLPRMHRLLVERGVYESSPMAADYREVLRRISAKPA